MVWEAKTMSKILLELIEEFNYVTGYELNVYK